MQGSVLELVTLGDFLAQVKCLDACHQMCLFVCVCLQLAFLARSGYYRLL